MTSTFFNHYIHSIISRFAYYKALGDKTIAQLNFEEMHFQTDEDQNSVALIIQHLHGNMMSRWTNFLTEDGEKPWRTRDAEFQNQQHSRDTLLSIWETGWNCLGDALKQLQPDDLEKTIYIRKEPLLVIDAIHRQLAHYPYHVGQMIYIAKMLKKEHWQQLSIEKGKSQHYNQQHMRK